MRIRRRAAFVLAGVVAMFLGAMAAAPVLAVAETVVTGPELDAAMAARTDQDAASREAILNLLGREETRDAAAKVGVDLDRLKASVSVLSGEELEDVAAQARLADRSLSGGDEKIVIGSTALIIILLVVIILVAGN
jgi:hypothetical protein